MINSSLEQAPLIIVHHAVTLESISFKLQARDYHALSAFVSDLRRVLFAPIRLSAATVRLLPRNLTLDDAEIRCRLSTLSK